MRCEPPRTRAVWRAGVTRPQARTARSRRGRARRPTTTAARRRASWPARRTAERRSADDRRPGSASRASLPLGLFRPYNATNTRERGAAIQRRSGPREVVELQDVGGPVQLLETVGVADVEESRRVAHPATPARSRRRPSPGRCPDAAATARRAAPAPGRCRPAAARAGRRRRAAIVPARSRFATRSSIVAGRRPRGADRERQADRARVGEPLAVEPVEPEHVAVVGEEDDHRVVELPARRDRVDQIAWNASSTDSSIARSFRSASM